MGLYDTINFKCPNCGKNLYAQSKSGDCCLGEYSHTEVPLSVAYDANRHAPFNCECGKSWYLDTDVLPEEITKINLPIKEYKS